MFSKKTSRDSQIFINCRGKGCKPPAVIRTKKAELRAERLSPVLSEKGGNDNALHDFEKRQQWRQARSRCVSSVKLLLMLFRTFQQIFNTCFFVVGNSEVSFRYKSLEIASAKAESVMNQVREISSVSFFYC